MATPLFRGKPYNTRFNVPTPIASLNENDSLANINVGKKYSFTPGNTVIVRGFFDASSGFEAVVDTYDPETGIMNLIEITNVKGFSSSVGSFTMTLAGQRGSRIFHGTEDPANVTFGRPGDTYINDLTGKVYYK